MKPIDQATIRRMAKLHEILENLEKYRPKTKRQKFLEKLERIKPHLRQRSAEKPPSKAFQVKAIKRLFSQLNPDSDPETIDFKALTQGNLHMDENLETFEREYPGYAWRAEAAAIRVIIAVANW